MPDALVLVAFCLATAVLTVAVMIVALRFRRKAPHLAPNTGRHGEEAEELGEIVPASRADVVLCPTKATTRFFA
jgi:hypothetical protein